jgi:antitoxin ParD1/3/4
MTTMNISLPAELKSYVDLRIQKDAYGTSSEYVRELIRKDRDLETLKAYMLEGIQSSSAGTFDAEYIDALKQRVQAQQAPKRP